MAKTNKDYKVKFQGEELIIPKGTKLTHQTAMGFDLAYNFVDDFKWYKPEITGYAREMALHDMVHSGINVPREFVTMDEIDHVLLGAEDQQMRTELFHDWIKNQNDHIKLAYRINWRIPHSLFNISCKYFDGALLQNINWFEIHKTNDIGKWSREIEEQTKKEYNERKV
jgi:hypothetical protein